MDLIGRKFNMVYVESLAEKDRYGNKRYYCLCDCGKKFISYRFNIKKGIESCGCQRVKRMVERSTKHKMTNTPTYRSWISMKSRCYDKNKDNYHRYGGRGIKVCDRWLKSFDNFYGDMGDRPKGSTLDRINVNGNYCPDNCRWANQTEQSLNKEKYKLSNMGIKNIREKQGLFFVDVTRYGYRRRISGLKELELAIKIKEYWIKEYDLNKENWICETKNKRYIKKTKELFNIV